MSAKFCWHCGGQLQGEAYAELKDQLGHSHRVHKCCLPNAEESVQCLTAGLVEVDVRSSEWDWNDND